MKLQIQIYSAVIVAIVVGALFFLSNYMTRDLLQNHAQVLNNISDLQRLEQELRVQLLEATSHIEYEYDSLQDVLARLIKLASNLSVEQRAKKSYPETAVLFAEYVTLARQREELIQKFNTINSVIKNSTAQIPTLGSRYLSEFGSSDTEYLFELSRLTASTFQAANSMDQGYRDIIRDTMSRLGDFELPSEQKKAFNQTLLSHARVFLRYIPFYRPLIYQIEQVPAPQKLAEARSRFIVEGESESTKVSTLNLLLALAFIGAVALVIYFLTKLNKEHIKLVSLHERLEMSARNDGLTGLPNRFAFDHDRKVMKAPGLIIINLDSFKHLNDFYGTDAGDYILREVSRHLMKMVESESNCRLYRLGGDEFGVLVHSLSDGELRSMATKYVRLIEGIPLQYGDHLMNLAARAGCTSQLPLLEKADMALKQAKHGRERVLVYDDGLGLQTRVEHNLRTLQMVKQAIERGDVVPFFQPILNMESKQITRYECLMRIIGEDGKVVLPGEFLYVAKESNLYDELTRIMIDKCIDRFVDQPHEFSINISIEDILDNSVTDFLFRKLDENPGVAHRMILEVLESEGVESYEAIKRFVKRAQGRGCQVAIDDFGSGYSSLQHVLELKADILKIDGSLVRELHHDHSMQLLVAAIMEFVRGVGVKTVTAEFVHNHEVLEMLEKLGIHYAQGFHIGKPEPDLVETDKISTWV